MAAIMGAPELANAGTVTIKARVLTPGQAVAAHAAGLPMATLRGALGVRVAAKARAARRPDPVAAKVKALGIDADSLVARALQTLYGDPVAAPDPAPMTTAGKRTLGRL